MFIVSKHTMAINKAGLISIEGVSNELIISHYQIKQYYVT